PVSWALLLSLEFFGSKPYNGKAPFFLPPSEFTQKILHYRVRVTVVQDVSAETLLSLTLKTVRRGSIVYTDKFRSYDSLMFCGYRHLKVDHNKRFASGKVYINGLEGFWSWAI
ncbi:MAG: transposase, partial [Deltaproteobacteria bacterium]|nr:transposase [Deltaproteobacteria bacterium]